MLAFVSFCHSVPVTSVAFQLETRLPLGLHVNTVSCHGATRLAAPYGGDFMPSLGALKGSYQLEVLELRPPV